MEVVVQAPWGLRERVAGTIHRVRVDAAGCPATHPISTRPGLRPSPPVDVAVLRAVRAVSASKYELRARFGAGEPPWLVSSLRLDGAAADRAIRRIALAPAGGAGSGQPGGCLPEMPYGEDAIVLRVRSAAGLTELMVRYSGCAGHGFDDGAGVRRLTLDALAPFTAAPNTVTMLPDGLVR